MVLCPLGAYFCYTTAQIWVANCVPWERSKRAACIGLVGTLSRAGVLYNIFRPPIRSDSDYIGVATKYFGIVAGCSIVAAGLAWCLRWRLGETNRRLKICRNTLVLSSYRAKMNAEFYDPSNSYLFPR
ncbi:hypothetical protein GGS23DRAFT_437804 [Durotheca rogersii]|uniref:uncharacterized protein n=1 Tax=Durotheca rogersii TaxID=419775 RepID=UPI00221FE8BD|nr:uncharacterized protein GGS23DRAFT_437804 [Durotheca rogersii]KAI5856145.1 hypothetical protein GGS23DRAFT_437804 [Durotheca rogersii]